MIRNHWRNHNRIISTFIVIAMSIVTGCAAARVANRPGQKDLSVLNAGTARGRVIAELGSPASTSEKQGRKVDSFAFDPGVSGAYKFGRAFFHIGADVFTLWLWEVVGWPGEIAASNSRMKLDITYDDDDKVLSVMDWKKKGS